MSCVAHYTLRVVEAAGDIGIEQFNVAFLDGGHGQLAATTEAFEAQDAFGVVELDDLVEDDGSFQALYIFTGTQKNGVLANPFFVGLVHVIEQGFPGVLIGTIHDFHFGDWFLEDVIYIFAEAAELEGDGDGLFATISREPDLLLFQEFFKELDFEAGSKVFILFEEDEVVGGDVVVDLEAFDDFVDLAVDEDFFAWDAAFGELFVRILGFQVGVESEEGFHFCLQALKLAVLLQVAQVKGIFCTDSIPVAEEVFAEGVKDVLIFGDVLGDLLSLLIFGDHKRCNDDDDFTFERGIGFAFK